KQLDHSRHLRLSTNEGGRGSGKIVRESLGIGSRYRLPTPDSRFPLSNPDAFVESVSLAGRLKAHLLCQHLAAGVILGESRAALSRASEQAHSLAMALFVPWFQFQLPHDEAQRL